MSGVIHDIQRLAQAGAAALNSLNYNADFSIRSLRFVDRFFDDHAEGGEAKPNGELAEDTGPRIFAIGAYVGETVRRAYGGRWKGGEKGPDDEWNVELHLPDGAIIWPMQRVAKRFKNGPEDGIYAYAVAVAPRTVKAAKEQRPWWKFW